MDTISFRIRYLNAKNKWLLIVFGPILFGSHGLNIMDCDSHYIEI